jgi:hypothetical protein
LGLTIAGWKDNGTRIEEYIKPCYGEEVEKTAQNLALPPSQPLASLSFQDLAEQQGVTPVENFESLIGVPSPEDESAEEFSAMLRAWRREGTGLSNSR